METIRIPNLATYSPVALTDVMMLAPLAGRVLVRLSPVGQALQTAAMAGYAVSALQDWAERRGVRRVDFAHEFAADVDRLDTMSIVERERELEQLAQRLHDGLVVEQRARERTARDVDHHLTATIASITQQRIETSTEVRSFSVASFIMPFAVGSCDIISGDVGLYRDLGELEPHLIAHEFCHRKGYLKELHAQALAYLALVRSGDPLLVQSALLERTHRHLKVLANDNRTHYLDDLTGLGLPRTLDGCLRELWPDSGRAEGYFSKAMKRLYEERMKLTGQNGLSDYDEGFTNFLFTFARSDHAAQDPTSAAV